jgi:RNA polymerase sigma factor (sigma-70 family)
MTGTLGRSWWTKFGTGGNTNMARIENWQSMILTKEQQKLVADNECVIRAVFKKFAREYNLTEPNDNFYGDAAIYLCKAALYVDDVNYFFAYSYTFVKWAMPGVLEDKYSQRTINIDEENDELEELSSLIQVSDDKWDHIEYKIFAESVYQRVEPVLTPEEKEAFKLCLDGKTIKDIARILKIKYGAAKRRTRMAKKKCKDFFNPKDDGYIGPKI